MKHYLEQFFDEIVIYAYVREPIGYIVSSFQQQLQVRHVFFDPKLHYPNYRNKFLKFERVFGGVNYRLFERSSLKNGSVVSDFLEWINLDSREDSDLRANITLSMLATKFLYHFQREAEGQQFDPKKNAKLLAVMRTLPGERLRLKRGDVERIRQLRQDDVAWMNNRFGRNAIVLREDGLEAGYTTEDDFRTLDEGEFNRLGALSADREFKAIVEETTRQKYDAFLRANFVKK